LVLLCESTAENPVYKMPIRTAIALTLETNHLLT